jgi:hypothetical protein
MSYKCKRTDERRPLFGISPDMARAPCGSRVEVCGPGPVNIEGTHWGRNGKTTFSCFRLCVIIYSTEYMINELRKWQNSLGCCHIFVVIYDLMGPENDGLLTLLSHILLNI